MQPQPPVRLAPIVRVVDATLAAEGGVASFVVSGLARTPEVADAVAKAGGLADLIDGRLHATTLPSRLVDAAGRVGGTELADPLRRQVDIAVRGWTRPATALATPAGDVELDHVPAIMGIINVTPDSFSDGGDHATAEAAIEHGRRLADEGAVILDVGGESTRPGAEPVEADEELRRIEPVIRALADDGHIVSVDTSKAAVAKAGIAAGAAIVNDVSGGTADHAMLTTVAGLGVPYVAMHTRGTPATMQDRATYDDVTSEVYDEVTVLVRRALDAGIDRSRLVVDPGIGFAKTADHNLTLLRDVRQFRSVGAPVLVGASRKSFLGRILGTDDPLQRLEGSLAAAVAATLNGASILRVHDVAATMRAVAVAAAIAAGSLPPAASD